MAITQGIMTSGNIRLGDFEMIMDFFSNPEEYEPDLSEVKVAINDKKPVEIVRKPVIKPKLTREGLINKYSLVSVQKEIKKDNILTDDLVINETDDFDFGDMDFDIKPNEDKVENREVHEVVNGIELDIEEDDMEYEVDSIERDDNNTIEDDIDLDDIDFDDDEDEAAITSQVENSRVNNKPKEVVNGIEFDFDDDFGDEDDEEEDIPKTTQSKAQTVNKPKEVVNGIEFDFGDDFEDDFDEDDDHEEEVTPSKPMLVTQPKPQNKPKEVVNGIEFDFDDDEDDYDDFTDFDDDDDTIVDTKSQVKETVVKKVEAKPKEIVNGIEFDFGDDFDDDFDDEDEEEFKTPVQNKTNNIVKQSTQVISKPTNNSVAKTSEKESVNGIEFDIDLDDFDDEDEEDEVALKPTNSQVESKQIPVSNKANASATSVNSNSKINNNIFEEDSEDDDLDSLMDELEDGEDIPVQKQTISHTEKSNNDETAKLLAELERLKAENDKLRQSSNSIKTPQVKVEEKKAEVVQPKKKVDIVDKLSVTRTRKDDTVKEEAGSKYDKYTVMNINALYSNVSRYMISKGVKNKPIDINELNEKFGPENIKKLIVKQYLIKTKKGVTVGL